MRIIFILYYSVVLCVRPKRVLMASGPTVTMRAGRFRGLGNVKVGCTKSPIYHSQVSCCENTVLYVSTTVIYKIKFIAFSHVVWKIQENLSKITDE